VYLYTINFFQANLFEQQNGNDAATKANQVQGEPQVFTNRPENFG